MVAHSAVWGMVASAPAPERIERATGGSVGVDKPTLPVEVARKQIAAVTKPIMGAG